MVSDERKRLCGPEERGCVVLLGWEVKIPTYAVQGTLCFVVSLQERLYLFLRKELWIFLRTGINCGVSPIGHEEVHCEQLLKGVCDWGSWLPGDSCLALQLYPQIFKLN